MENYQMRQGAIEDVLRDLDRLILTRHAFDTIFNNHETGETVKIVYIDRSSFFFIIKQPDAESVSWKTIESPGDYLLGEQTFILDDFARCRSRINSWAQRIIQELTFRKKNILPDIQQLRKNLEKNAEELENPDEPFTEEDASVWNEKVDKIVQEIESLREQYGIQQGEIRTLKSELEVLKQQTGTLSKKTWLKAVGNKIINVFETSTTTGVKAIVETVVKGLISRGGDGT